MLTLDIWNESNINNPYRIEDIVKNISVDEQLTNNLESSSAIWKVTLPHDCPYSLTIIQKDDLHAKLYDGATVFFIGWVSTNFSYVIDTHGQQAVQITLEDNGTHLLKAPYIKDQSYEISGKFSSTATGDLGVVQKICEKCGITFVGGVTNNTVVTAVADAGETCESLLKSVCKEMGYVYLFNENGQLYLKALSTDTLPTGNTIYDNSIYDSINLTRRARTYRGSRVKWNELGTKTDCLIYRVIEGQSTIYPNCYVEVHTGDTLPDPQGGITYIAASDIKDGSEIFSITNVQPSIESSPNDIITPNFFGRKGAKDLAILITANNDGHITKMEATATVRYIKNHNVTYGDAADPDESITENLHEEECRWLHSDEPNSQDPSVLGPVTRYANFLAQYDRYCSSEFQFKTKGTYSLGDIIHLNENLHTTLNAYLMVTRRSRTLTSYDSTNKTFGGVWTYTAVSTRAFDYNKTTSEESTSIPPSTSYTETQPDVSDISSLQLYTDKSFLVKNLRSTAIQTMTIKASVTGGLVVSLTSASYSDGTSIPIYDDRTHTSDIPRIQPVDTSPETWTFEDGWELICYENKDAESVNITGEAGTLTNTIGISLNDKTEYSKFLGNFQNDSACISNYNGPILVHDFFMSAVVDPNTQQTLGTGITRECYGYDSVTGDPLFTDMPLNNAENARKFLISLNSATQARVALEDLNNPNTVSWFNLIIASKAVIDSLFSKTITIMTGGAIHSESYSDAGVKLNTNPGFWLGSNGQLLCDSGQMTNLAISGNSVFSGRFNCTAIQTAISEPYVIASATAQTSGTNWQANQAMWLHSALGALGYGSTMVPCRLQNIQSDVSYFSLESSDPEGRYRNVRIVKFYDSNGNIFDLRTISALGMSTGGSGTPTDPNNKCISYFGDPMTSSRQPWWSYSSNGFTVELLAGGNTLIFNIPGSSTGLTSGMAYRDSSGYLRIV